MNLPSYLNILIEPNPYPVSKSTLWFLLIAALIALFIILILTIKIAWQAIKYSSLRQFLTPILLFQIASLSILIPFLPYTIIELVTNNEKTFKYKNLGFIIFLILIILANLNVFNKLARIPEKRKTQFKITNIVFTIEILLFFIFLFFENNVMRLFITVFGFLSILYFYLALRHEQHKNSSKLIKARLKLLEYTSIINIIWVLSTILRPVFIALGNYDLALLVFFPIPIASIINAFLYSWVFEIPQWLRIKYNIPQSRFQQFKSL